jgi:hypothetical protein
MKDDWYPNPDSLTLDGDGWLDEFKTIKPHRSDLYVTSHRKGRAAPLTQLHPDSMVFKR